MIHWSEFEYVVCRAAVALSLLNGEITAGRIPSYQFRAKVTLCKISLSTNCGRVTYMRGTQLGHLWFWWLPVAGRNQAITWPILLIVNWALRRKHQWNFNRKLYISFKKIYVNMSCRIWLSFCLSLIMSTEWGYASWEWLRLTHPASNAILRHWFGSTLAQVISTVMARCPRWHQAISWSNVVSSWVRSCYTNVKALSGLIWSYQPEKQYWKMHLENHTPITQGKMNYRVGCD